MRRRRSTCLCVRTPVDINNLMMDEVYVSSNRHTNTYPWQVEWKSADLPMETADPPMKEITDDHYLCDPL